MVDRNQDLFVQIDALLGKRSSEALTEKIAEVDDFPMLTEIITVDDEKVVSAESSTSYPGERRQAERRTLKRRQSELGVTDANELAALEQRMKDLIDMQREQLETLIRQIIRDELHNR